MDVKLSEYARCLPEKERKRYVERILKIDHIVSCDGKKTEFDYSMRLLQTYRAHT